MGVKIRITVFYCVPIVLLVALIPFIANDYLLTGIYAACIAALLFFKSEKHDWLILVFGFLAMIGAEALFVSTGVETFTRHTLFGLMPLWLPFLWGYAFVTMKRVLKVLGH